MILTHSNGTQAVNILERGLAVVRVAIAIDRLVTLSNQEESQPIEHDYALRFHAVGFQVMFLSNAYLKSFYNRMPV